MYVVFLEDAQDGNGPPLHTARTLEQAFAQIVCRCGYAYRFEAAEAGWRLVITDVERLECSPDPIFSTCIKPRDAQYDLMMQAVDGRLKGNIAVSAEDYRRARVMRMEMVPGSSSNNLPMRQAGGLARHSSWSIR